MPDMNPFAPQGMLHEGWSARVDDYALTCGWGNSGKTLFVGDVAGGLYAFKADSGELNWHKKDVHQGGLLALSIHPKADRLATSGQDGSILIWDGDKGNILHSIQPRKNWVEHLAWSDNGQQLAAASGRHVHTYNSDGIEQWTSDAHPSTVSAISWSKPDELASACYGRVRFFNLTNHQDDQTLEWQGSLVSMVLSPDGDIVACGSQDNSVHFWRRTTGKDAEMTGYAN